MCTSECVYRFKQFSSRSIHAWDVLRGQGCSLLKTVEEGSQTFQGSSDTHFQDQFGSSKAPMSVYFVQSSFSSKVCSAPDDQIEWTVNLMGSTVLPVRAHWSSPTFFWLDWLWKARQITALNRHTRPRPRDLFDGLFCSDLFESSRRVRCGHV